MTVFQAQKLYGMVAGQDARALSAYAHYLARAKKILAHVVADDQRLDQLQSLLSFFDPSLEVLLFPAWDCLPYDRVSPQSEVMAQRVACLCRLLEWQKDGLFRPRIVLIPSAALGQKIMPLNSLEKAKLDFRKGQALDLKLFQSYLHDNGYARTDTVREAGEYAIRGSIIDLFPSGYKDALRLDLFGDDIETIKFFDPITQRSTGFVDHFSLRPVSELFLNQDTIDLFRQRYRHYFGVQAASHPLYQAVSEGRKLSGMEHWLPLFHSELVSFDAYCPNACWSLDAQIFQIYDERFDQIKDFFQARMTLDESLKAKTKKGKDVSLTGQAYHPLPPEEFYLSPVQFRSLLDQKSVLMLQNFMSAEDPTSISNHSFFYPPAKVSRDFADIRAQTDGHLFPHVIGYLKGFTAKKAIACYSKGSRDRLKLLLDDTKLGSFLLYDDFQSFLKEKNAQSIGLFVVPLERGFVSEDLVFVSEQDILGDRLLRSNARKRKSDNFIKEISSLSPNDLVVHVDHGIGRFEKLETIEAGGLRHDCLKIIYAGGDKLFVPVENIEVLSRYGHDEGQSDLDKLGGAAWQARKARIKKDLLEMADGLLAIAAERALRQADKIIAPNHEMAEFVARFPYQETEDQLRAIQDTLTDLQSGQAMDRLVCGDVGFGKTEIALRAAYAAAMNGHQVALIAPTTLLARQHYNNFLSRFSGFGFRIEQLSRLVSPKDAKRTKEDLEKGEVQIVIGTHSLLSESIQFSNLGLVIVDEEQRFGVKQKERLKELKSNVHVLTLTATPIPRTLQMALTGVRDMSIIATPPVDRLAVRTFVTPYDPLVIREAILREHYRGGQSFYVVPRIKDMEEVEQNLKELVPEVKIITAHGQMSPTDLEDRMTSFYDGKYGILLATNIIESGLDIPSANTIIIYKADLFGLAQLYQLRGRVGRSKARAYAYITHDPNIILTEQAQKRLQIFETLDSLGAGFQLASHDLDIRGAGNLLGDAQSGHVKEVGIELYQQMLEDAVQEARQNKGAKNLSFENTHNIPAPTINLGSSVLIPENYVADLNIRMSLYRRLADMSESEDIENFAIELIDRFGPFPNEVQNLLDVMSIKILCRKAHIQTIDAGPKGVIFSFVNNTPPNPEALMRYLQERAGLFKVRPDQKIAYLRPLLQLPDRVKAVQSLIQDITHLFSAA
jgi:transcription-repair coupling factor (superfamily II helicase)